MEIFSVAVVDDLVPRPKEHIIEKHGDDIWDSVSHELRQRVSHDDLDDLDDDGRLFTGEGHEIHRYYPIVPNRVEDACGVLVDFNNIHTLFGVDENLTYSRAGPETSKYFAYPQAGLVTAGHVQATSLISEFYPQLERVNVKILKSTVNHRDDVDGDIAEPKTWAVYGISTQIYNAVMHHTRGKGSQHHEVARGIVSGALGGLCISETASSKKAKNLRRSCLIQMPHQSYDMKASNPEICKDLRMENVFWIDFDEFPDDNRDGR
jgi:hypothetical protein